MDNENIKKQYQKKEIFILKKLYKNKLVTFLRLVERQYTNDQLRSKKNDIKGT